ncbi:MAG: flavodoxin family protein [Methanobacterium sp. ERen5]|nr:MAG: flavodoxin family protein [Methanobacterium sp. ERen5]
MKIIGINGSPRKEWNTAKLIKKALEGAKSEGAETELIHLYDLEYKGCKSCFACKTKGSRSYGRCNVKDDLTTLFEKIENVDALILGSPIYFGVVTGEMRSFMERMIFPYFTYTSPPKSLFPNQISSAFIYTMNIPEEMIEDSGYKKQFEFNKQLLTLLFGSSESFMSYDTYQFNDYSRVVADKFDPVHKAKHRDKQFPMDKEAAFKLGIRMVKSSA